MILKDSPSDLSVEVLIGIFVEVYKNEKVSIPHSILSKNMQVKTGPSLRGLRSWALHMCYILAMNYHLCVLLLTKPDSSVGGASAVGSWRQLGSHYSRSLCTIKPADRQLGRYSQSENKNLEFKLSDKLISFSAENRHLVLTWLVCFSKRYNRFTFVCLYIKTGS